MSTLKIATVEEAQRGVQVSKIQKESPQELHAVVMAAIVDVGEVTQSKIEGSLAGRMATGLLQDFWYMKLDDVLLFLSKGARGHYGRIYGSVGAPELYQWGLTYDEERSSLYEAKNKRLQKKIEVDTSLVPVDYRAWIKNRQKIDPEDKSRFAEKKKQMQEAFAAIYGANQNTE